MIILSPSHVIVRMRQLLIPKPIQNNALLGLQSFKPIQSDHWGERASEQRTSLPSRSS